MVKQRKKTRKGLPAKGRLRDIADSLWSVAIREDWNWQCAVCGKGKCEAHHLIPRECEAFRYSLENGIALCSQHHRFDPMTSPHQNAAGWLDWLADHYPIRHDWYINAIENGEHMAFNGIKNHDYYIDMIRFFVPHVPESEFTRIVGVKLRETIQNAN